MKYLSFTLCLVLGIGVYFLSPGASVRSMLHRAPEAAPRKVVVVVKADKPRVVIPTEYVTVPISSEASGERVTR